MRPPSVGLRLHALYQLRMWRRLTPTPSAVDLGGGFGLLAGPGKETAGGRQRRAQKMEKTPKCHGTTFL
jgi:hypothetical protein